MIEYEFRILAGRQTPPLIIEAFHPTNVEAIRTISKLADDRAVEVWQGAKCIYRAPAKSIANHEPVSRILPVKGSLMVTM
jgi:hypothetical protein